MNDFVKYTVYFLLGGTIVSVSTYLGSQGKSFLAAFASTFPAITGATFVLIYLNGGNEAIVSYAKNLLWFVPPWIGLRHHHDCWVSHKLRFWPCHDRLTSAVSGLRGAPQIRGSVAGVSQAFKRTPSARYPPGWLAEKHHPPVCSLHTCT